MNRVGMPFDHGPQGHVGSILADLVVDLVSFALNVNQARWHAVGPGSPCLRRELASLVTEVSESLDRLAERAVTLGVPVDGRPFVIGRARVLKEFPFGFIADGEATAEIAHQMSDVVVRTRAAVEALGPIDPVSQHLVIGMLGDLERRLWILQTQGIGRSDLDSEAPVGVLRQLKPAGA